MSGYSISDALNHRDSAESRKKSRRRRRRWIAISLLVAAAAAAAAIFFIRPSPDDVFRDPESVDLPPIGDEAAATRAFLAGAEGATIRAFLDASEPLLGDSIDVAVCRESVKALDSIGSPESVYRAASGIPDPPTAEMAVAHIHATSRFLGQCLESAPASVDEIRFTSVILERRLGAYR